MSADAKAIFLDAIDEADETRRRARLDEACAGDAALRNRVDELIASFQAAGSFLDKKPGEIRVTLDMPAVSEKPGTQIGPYKLREQIGEGGFGVVYVAEQERPVARKVALKIIKPGMDTRDVIARFEAERQALALMDHPNIAKVLDAGTTGEPGASATGANDRRTPVAHAPGSPGRPYFVMELVRGVPITEFCDERKLNTRERLDLFIDVCRAVQHAHQKGIIHRDIKPSNVMVTLRDDKPIPKVIDFGVSKALSSKLTEKTIYTAYGQMIGTPLYMSPEQAQLNEIDVDTRSDVYSLGVLLYELLTGTTPFDKDTLQKSGFDEMRRIIREVDPPRPSARISTLNAELLSTISAKHHIDPRKLSASLRGELDWIVMKALEKDRNRRYESASAFAADVARYLADEPVQARLASAWYRLRKLARRRKGAFAATAVLSLALLVAVGAIAGSLGWLARDREARQTRLAQQVELILDDVDRLMREQKWPEALAAARRAEAAIESGDADEATRQQLRTILEDLRFIDRLERIRMERMAIVDGNFDYGGADRKYDRAFRRYGVDVDRMPVHISLERLKSRPALAVTVAAACDDWVEVRWSISRSDAGGRKRLTAIARAIDSNPLRDRLRATWGQDVTPRLQADLRRLAGSIDVDTQHPATLNNLAHTLRRAKLGDVAVQLLRRAQAAHPGDFWLNDALGRQLYWQRDYEGAIRFHAVAVSIRPNSTAAHNNLGLALEKLGRRDEAVACYRRAIELDPRHANAHTNLGIALRHQGRLGEAVACYRRAIELNPPPVVACMNLGDILSQQGKLDEAIACYRKASEFAPENRLVLANFGNALLKRNKVKEFNACYRTATEFAPKDPHLHIDFGFTLLMHGKRDEAVAAFRNATRIAPKDDRVLARIGSSMLRYDLFKQSEPLLRQCNAIREKRQPDDWRRFHSLSMLGGSLLGQGKYDDAEPLLLEGYGGLKARARQAQPSRVREALERVIALYEATNRTKKVAHWKAERHHWRLNRLRSRLTRLRKAHALRPGDSRLLNRLAWFLCTVEQQSLRNPGEAVALASVAVERAPKIGAYWNTLGVAHYRNGDWEAAIAALRKSMQLRQGGNGIDRFFLAMSHWQLGEQARAREWYDKAVGWMREHKPENQQLVRFRAEAEALLGLRQTIAAPRKRQPVPAEKPQTGKRARAR